MIYHQAEVGNIIDAILNSFSINKKSRPHQPAFLFHIKIFSNTHQLFAFSKSFRTSFSLSKLAEEIT